MPQITRDEWKNRQNRLNLFVEKVGLKGVHHLGVDGNPGILTHKAISNASYWLGWGKRTEDWSDKLDKCLLHPYDIRITSPQTVARGVFRRRAHNKAWDRAHQKPAPNGISTYDGIRVANCAIPILNWCREHGWHGKLISGYRDPAYSEHLCYQMCGAPSCRGKCAGRSSNHVGATCARFAVDVSDYGTFRYVVSRCPLTPRIFNSLPADPVHFSPSGN